MQTAGPSICKSCHSSCAPDDNFCQDCGAPRCEQALDSIVSIVPPQALLTCLNCGAQHEALSRYCASCGSLLSDVGVFTTAVDEAESSKPALVNPALVFSANQPGRQPVQPTLAKSGLLQSPLLRRATHPEQPALRQSYTTPNFLHTIVDLSPAILLLWFFALVVLWIVDADRVKGPQALQQEFARARTEASNRQFDKSLQTMEKLSLTRQGNLSVDERKLFNDDLFAVAEAQAARGNYNEAIFNLLKISPDYSNYSVARARIKELAASKVSERHSAPSPGKPAVDQALSGRAKVPASKDKSAQQNDSSPAAESRAGASAGSTAAAQNGTAKSTSGKGVSEVVSDNAVGRKSIMLLQQLHAPGAVPANSTESAAAAGRQTQTSSGSAATPPHQDIPAGAGYSDSDVARYNKLLADYFSKPHTDGNEPPAGQAPGRSEPPTLSEWLSQGKPVF